MKVADYLKSSGLQATASVSFTDLEAVLEGAAPPADTTAAAPVAAAPAPAAPAAFPPSPPTPPAPTVPAAAPLTQGATDHQARVMARLRAEFPDVAAQLEKEATTDEGAAPAA